MIKVVLHDALGERFGTDYELDAQSPREAIQALTKMLAGFEEVVRDNHFVMWIDDVNVGITTLAMDTHKDIVVRMALHVHGAGGDSGIWMAIAGVALIVVAWWNPAAWGAGVQLMVAGLGGAIAMTGIGSMMMPEMAVSTPDQEGNRSSYGFGGAVTTTEAGNVVPVAYGECWCGGFVLEYNITTKVTKHA